MSEGAAEGGGAPISSDQFGDGLTETGDIPPGQTAQNPGSGIFGMGWYPWYMAPNGGRYPRSRKRKRDE